MEDCRFVSRVGTVNTVGTVRESFPGYSQRLEDRIVVIPGTDEHVKFLGDKSYQQVPHGAKGVAAFYRVGEETK